MWIKKIGKNKLKMWMAIGGLISIGAMCGGLFYQGILHIHRPSRERFPIQGIDVSAHQGEIDWAKIDRTSVNFVFMKATEGGDFRDRGRVAGVDTLVDLNVFNGTVARFQEFSTGKNRLP